VLATAIRGWGASMIAYTSTTMAITASTAPLTSRRRGVRVSRLRGTKRRVPAKGDARQHHVQPETDGQDQTSRTSPEVSSPEYGGPARHRAQTLTPACRCSLAKVPVMWTGWPA